MRDSSYKALGDVYKQQDEQDVTITELKTNNTALGTAFSEIHSQFQAILPTLANFQKFTTSLASDDAALQHQFSQLSQLLISPGLTLMISHFEEQALVQAQQVQAIALAQQAQQAQQAQDQTVSSFAPSDSATRTIAGVSAENLAASEAYNQSVAQRFSAAVDPILDPAVPYNLKVTDKVHLVSLLSKIRSDPGSTEPQTLEQTLEVAGKDKLYIRTIGINEQGLNIQPDICTLVKIPTSTTAFDFQLSPAFIITGLETNLQTEKPKQKFAISTVYSDDGSFSIQLHYHNQGSTPWAAANDLVLNMGFLKNDGTVESNKIETTNADFFEFDVDEAEAINRPGNIIWEKQPVYASISKPLSNLLSQSIQDRDLHIVNMDGQEFIVLMLGMANSVISGLDHVTGTASYESLTPVTGEPANKRPKIEE